MPVATKAVHPATIRRLLAGAVALATVGALTVVAPAAGGASPAAGEPEGILDLVLTPVAALSGPIAMATRAGSDDLFVAQKGGQVRVLHVSGDTVTVDPTPLLDLSALIDGEGEGGLLGLTFNPAGDRLYVDHTNRQGDLRVAEYTVVDAEGGPEVVPGSRRVVLGIRHQPFSNHNGGDLTFGPDGRLYITTGDGGGGGDPARNGQNRTVLLGKILRINPTPTATRPYRIPPTNPFAGQSPRRGEIWLYGVRNPWRISFDSATGDLYVADVGQDQWEEINVLPADGNGRGGGRGANLGWSRMEGPDPYNGTEPANHTAPAYAYPHDGPAAITGCSIIGGYVYRGAAIPALVGQYVFGDFCTGTLSSVTTDGETVNSVTADLGVDEGDNTLVSFGQGPDGELYTLTFGGVARLEPAAP